MDQHHHAGTRRARTGFVLFLLCLSFAARAPRLEAQSVILKDAFPSLTFPAPVDVQNAADGTDRLFVVRQAGYIDVLSNTSAAPSSRVFLDIDAKVESGGELGLLGLAFHPGYDTNGYFYVDYTAASPLRTVVSRFSVSPTDPDSADPASEVVLLEVLQPYTNHNGGQLAFGPDGYLYIATGDGGSGGDPGNRAQDRTTLLGKILRIDVDAPSDTLEYSIPPTNPYAGNADGFREEIFAYGLRNPWRFSFDPATGTGWIGDVGQGNWEEVDILASGANYGWRLKEGTHCYDPPTGCNTIPGLTDPVWEYAHDAAGGCSITGGYVYRGAAMPWLSGKYLFGDYCSGRIWALDTNGAGEWQATLLLDTTRNLTSFGVDRQGELYVCSSGDGKVYRLVSAEPAIDVAYPAGWSLVSVPVATQGGLKDSLFPTAVSPAWSFEWDSGYAASDTLRAGRGYWLKFPAATMAAFTGAPRTADTIGVVAGWNLVGVPGVAVDPASIVTTPAGIVESGWYAYAGSYLKASSLESGRGYWVKCSGPGSIVLPGSILLPGAGAASPSSLRR